MNFQIASMRLFSEDPAEPSEIVASVEKELRKPIKHAAVMMALRRLAEKLQANPVALLEFTDE